MKIKSIDDYKIVFDNGSTLSYEHDQDCCENNFADFLHLDTEAASYDFPEELQFEAVEGQGFRFGDGQRMFFVPCYSDQNGYYSSDISILFNGQEIVYLEETNQDVPDDVFSPVRPDLRDDGEWDL